MYEKFTDRSRKVMSLANEEALRLKHDYVGTEHVLVALVREGSGVAAIILKNLGLDLHKIRTRVEEFVQRGRIEIPPKELPLTPRTKHLVENSLEEARKLRHSYVGTEHLLLGLL